MWWRERLPDHQRLAEPKPNSFSVLVTIDDKLVGDLDVPVLDGEIPQVVGEGKTYHERHLAAGFPTSAFRSGENGMASFRIHPDYIQVHAITRFFSASWPDTIHLRSCSVPPGSYYNRHFLDAGGIPLWQKQGQGSCGNFYLIDGEIKATGQPIELTVVYNF